MKIKLYKILLTLKFFLRYRQQKRKVRILIQQLAEEKMANRQNRNCYEIELSYKESQRIKDIDTLRETYENQIYLERFRGDSLQREMTDRFLQVMGLNPMLFTDLSAPSSPITKVKEEKINEKQEEIERERELRDVKAQFWVDGIEEGKDHQEIEYAWNMRKNEIYEDVKLSKYPTTLEQEQ